MIKLTLNFWTVVYQFKMIYFIIFYWNYFLIMSRQCFEQMAEKTNSKYAWLKEKKAERISKGHICISKDCASLFPSKHMHFIWSFWPNIPNNSEIFGLLILIPVYWHDFHTEHVTNFSAWVWFYIRNHVSFRIFYYRCQGRFLMNLKVFKESKNSKTCFTHSSGMFAVLCMCSEIQNSQPSLAKKVLVVIKNTCISL